MYLNNYKVYYCILLFCFYCFTQEQSHYDAALELMGIIHENQGFEFVDTVINKILEKEPDLKDSKDDIYTILQNYLNSSEYRETRIRAIMHYFNEIEIREITIKLKNPSFHNSTQEQMALLKKYERIFRGLEAEFIEYIKRKLHKNIKSKQYKRGGEK